MNQIIKLRTIKRNPLIRIIVWCFNRLSAANKLDLICAFIIFAQESKESQSVAFISCGHCPGKIPKGKGVRALGFREEAELETRKEE
ncbi:hypothetical protein ES703_33144 [subsurface metagenome]